MILLHGIASRHDLPLPFWLVLVAAWMQTSWNIWP